MTFQTRFPAAHNDPDALDVALNEMIEIAAKGGEESFHFVAGAVHGIRLMRDSFAADKARAVHEFTFDAAVRVWDSQELGDIVEE